MKEGRNHEIDVMKGILILMVVWGHIVYDVGKSLNLGWSEMMTGTVFCYTQRLSDLFIAPYYMAAFFCVTGYCSSFSRALSEQIKTDFRRLLVPAVLIPPVMKLFLASPMQSEYQFLIQLVHGRMPWFLIALFLSKTIYKILKEKISIVAIRWGGIFLSFIGCLLLNKCAEYNVLSIFHAMAFTLFIAIGHEARKHNVGRGAFFAALLCYGLILVLFRHLGYGIPALCAIITFRTIFHPIFVAHSISGTIICYFIAKFIGKSSVLEFLGRNSLVIYLTHVTFMLIAAPHMGDYIKTHMTNIGPSVFVVLVMLIGATLWGCFWAVIFNTKYLKWIIGK